MDRTLPPPTHARLEPLREKYIYLKNHPGFRVAPVATMTRLVDWRCRCALRVPGYIELSPGVRLFLPPLWRGVAKLLYAFRLNYESELGYLAGRLRPGMVVADVGACYGVYTVLSSKAVGERGLVLAFEPSAEAFGVLERNIKMNGCQNTRLFPCALADREGSARLWHYADPSRNSLCATAGASTGGERVAVRTLDGVLEEQAVDHVDVLKIDAEGAEELILGGARSLLNRSRPTVVFEVNAPASAAFGRSERGAWNTLTALGYQFFSIGTNGERTELKSPPAGGNVVAVHRSLE